MIGICFSPPKSKFLSFNWDREEPRGFPPNRTYGSRIRRFGGLSARAQFSTRLGSPKAATYRQGSAITSAGLWLKRHGPRAGLTVLQGKSALTPRCRSSRLRRRPHCFPWEFHSRRRIHLSRSVNGEGISVNPKYAHQPRIVVLNSTTMCRMVRPTPEGTALNVCVTAWAIIEITA